MNPAITHPQFITDEEGHKTAVILSMEDYSELLEDLSDLAAIAERRDDGVISHEDLLATLRSDGIL